MSASIGEVPAVEATGTATTRGRPLREVLTRVFKTSDWCLRLWDGETSGPPDGGRFTISLASPSALDRFFRSHPERAFGRGYASGEIDVEPVERLMEALAGSLPRDLLAAAPGMLRASWQLGARPRRSRPSALEANLDGARHSRARDAAAISHHYDLPPEFFALWLDRSMTYSCAYFRSRDDDLETAQEAKLDLICRKLRLRPGESLLDIGSGWGSLGIFAAQNYGVSVTGLNVSSRQLEVSRARVDELGLGEKVDFRFADYRDPLERRFDAVASVGMVEHVGRRRLAAFAATVRQALGPGGRALVHGIVQEPGAPDTRSNFVDGFIFPDGELQDTGFVVTTLERAGLEVRDVENLREHYELTLDRWLSRLRESWRAGEAIVGAERMRIWQLYLAASMVGFRCRSLALQQTLCVVPGEGGRVNLPLTRADWYQT